MNGLSFEDWSVAALGVVLVGASAAIVLVGSRLTRLADRLADVTGLGEAVFGAVLLGRPPRCPV